MQTVCGPGPGATTGIREVIMRHLPFAQLVRLGRKGPVSLPRVLIATPLSGHKPALLWDMAFGLLDYADVHFIAWTDASEVPMDEGPFGLDENIGYLLEFLRCLGPDTHVVAFSQSPLPALAATALLAEGFGAASEPASLTLISGFLDPRINPTRVGLLLTTLPHQWFRRLTLRKVPEGSPASGRRIYPAHAQALGLGAYLLRHLTTMDELWFKTFLDDGDPAGPRFLASYLALSDLPSEIVADMIKAVFHEHALASGRLCWRGHRVSPAAISRCGLMTVEGGRDDVSGLGQTFVAHRLCPNLPAARRDCHFEPGIGHFGAFHGNSWRRHILPRVLSFIRRCEDSR